MKRLFLLRHAKSKHGEEYATDAERPLAKRGKRDAKRMGKAAQERGWVPALIISSPAKRARQTATRFAKAAGYELEIQHTASIYMEGTGGILDAIQAAGAEVDSVMVVGHNPDLETLASWLTKEEVNLKTATLACIDLPVDAWAKAGERNGELVAVLSPKDLD